MSWRTTLAGVLAALAVLAALSEIPPWARAIAGVLHALALAFLGAVSRDHAAPVPLPCEPVERVTTLRVRREETDAEGGKDGAP